MRPSLFSAFSVSAIFPATDQHPLSTKSKSIGSDAFLRNPFGPEGRLIILLLYLPQRSFHRVRQRLLFFVLHLKFYQDRIKLCRLRLQHHIVSPEPALPVGCDRISVGKFYQQPEHKPVIKAFRPAETHC